MSEQLPQWAVERAYTLAADLRPHIERDIIFGDGINMIARALADAPEVG